MLIEHETCETPGNLGPTICLADSYVVATYLRRRCSQLMSKDHDRPYPIPEGQGIDQDYEKVRETAKRELQDTMAGPAIPLQQEAGEDLKNPEGEFAVPTPTGTSAQQSHAPHRTGGGAEKQRDPQGQQGGTGGGQPDSPLPDIPGRIQGTPLADPDDRAEQSTQRKGTGADGQFEK